MGESKNSLINLGDWSKPANTLIEKISDAVGGLYKPFQTRRVAQAEADADKIRAVTQIEITELQQRAMVRLFSEEAKKQHNIEAITLKALPDVRPESRPEDMEDDWIANFFDKCRLISDEQMQSLWARILAGEANSPGKFSKRYPYQGWRGIGTSLWSTTTRGFCRLCERAVEEVWNHDRTKSRTANGTKCS